MSRSFSNTHEPRGRGSNHEKQKYCHRCDRRTTHLFDHGEGIHICSECEL